MGHIAGGNSVYCDLGLLINKAPRIIRNKLEGISMEYLLDKELSVGLVNGNGRYIKRLSVLEEGTIIPSMKSLLITLKEEELNEFIVVMSGNTIIGVLPVHGSPYSEGDLNLKITCVLNGYKRDNFLNAEDLTNGRLLSLNLHPEFKVVLPNISKLCTEVVFYLKLHEIVNKDKEVSLGEDAVNLSFLLEEFCSKYEDRLGDLIDNLLGRSALLQALGVISQDPKNNNPYLEKELTAIVADVKNFMVNELIQTIKHKDSTSEKAGIHLVK